MKAALADRNDLHALVRIWEESFPEEDRVSLYRFFLDFFPHTRTYVYRSEGKILSAASSFDIEYHNRKGAYLYGVCTLPAYRGQGLSRALLAEIESLLKQAGYAFILLRPASESLFGFYRRSGYLTELHRCSLELSPDLFNPENLPCATRLQASCLDRLRRKYYGSQLVNWSRSELDFIIGYYSGTYALALDLDLERYLIGTVDGDCTECFNLLEIGCRPTREDIRATLSQAAAIVRLRYPFIRRLDLSLPVPWNNLVSGRAKKQRFTLGKSLSDDDSLPGNPYFTLVME